MSNSATESFGHANSGSASSSPDFIRPLLIGLGVIAVLGAAGSYFSAHREEKSEAQRAALYLGQRAYETELSAIAATMKPVAPAPTEKKGKGEAKPAAPAAPSAETLVFTKLDVDKQLAETVKKYHEVSAKFAGTQAASEAQLILGNIYYRHGNPAAAAEEFQRAFDQAPSTASKAAALSALGYAQENAGKPKEAAVAFEKALEMGEAPIKGDLLLAAARCYEAAGDSAKARSKYDQIIKQFPNSEHSRTAERFLSLLP